MNDKDNEKEQERTIPGFDVQARVVTNWGAWGKEQQAQQDFEKRREEWMRQEALHEADMTSEDPQVSDDAVNDEDRLTVIGAERQLIAREMAERGLERLDKWREKWKAAHEDLTLEKKLARAREALERSRDDLTKRQNDTKALRKDFSTLQALRETAEYNLSGFLVGDPEPFDISQLSIPLQKEVENRIAQNLSAGGEVNFEAADRMTAELMAVEAVRDRLERQLRQSAIGDVKTGESSQIQALEKKIEKQGDELLALMEERITQLKASLETSAQPQSSRAGAEGDPLENELKQAEEERRNEVRRQIEELYEANRNNREAREGIEDDLTTSKDKLREMSRAVDRLQQERATVEGSAPASLFEETELLKEQFDEWKEERTGLIDRIQDLQDIQQRRSEKIQRLDRLARQWIPSEQQEVLDLAAGDDGQEEDELDAQLEAREANAWNLQLQERKLQWSLAELNSWALGSQMDSARRDMVTSDSTAGSQQWLRKFEQLLDKSLDDMPVDKLPQLMELKADRDGVKEDEELLLNELGAAQEDDSPEPLTWTLQDERDEPERLDELEEAAARLLGEDDDFVKNFRRQRQEWRDALNRGDPSGQPSEPFLSPERLRDMRDAVQQTVSNELKRIKSEENRLRNREHGKISFERENLMAWFSPLRLRSSQREWVASFVRSAEKQLHPQDLTGAEKEAEVLKIVHRDVGNSRAWMNRLHKEKRFPLLNEFWTQIGKELPSLFQEVRLDRELKSLQERRQNFQPEIREMERNAQRRQGNLGLALREFGRGQTPDGTPPLTWSLKDEVTDRERL
ncbi:MAG TPA: hypothetical protein VM532_02055, partial [Burkholderiales bacterium]|nr:hypothetical protein [Burkholderiales bacterium]